jgi:hypothetical protein
VLRVIFLDQAVSRLRSPAVEKHGYFHPESRSKRRGDRGPLLFYWNFGIASPSFAIEKPNLQRVGSARAIFPYLHGLAKPYHVVKAALPDPVICAP